MTRTVNNRCGVPGCDRQATREIGGIRIELQTGGGQLLVKASVCEEHYKDIDGWKSLKCFVTFCYQEAPRVNVVYIGDEKRGD